MSDQFTHPYEEPDRFKCCTCQRIFYGIVDANNHRTPIHEVVPITECMFCHGCEWMVAKREALERVKV